MSELEDRLNSVLSDPEQMAKISKLAQSFMAGDSSASKAGGAAPGAPFGGAVGDDALGLDPAMLGRIGRLLSGGAAENKQERALLEAMRPYLSEKRRSKMDKAMRIARLAGIARIAMGEMGGDGDDKSL